MGAESLAMADNRKVLDKAAALVAKGKLEKALEVYQEAIALDASDPIPLQRRAELLLRMGSEDEAITSYIAASRLYTKAEDAAKAAALYRTVLRVRPDHASARAGLEAAERRGKPVVPVMTERSDLTPLPRARAIAMPDAARGAQGAHAEIERDFREAAPAGARAPFAPAAHAPAAAPRAPFATAAPPARAGAGGGFEISGEDDDESAAAPSPWVVSSPGAVTAPPRRPPTVPPPPPPLPPPGRAAARPSAPRRAAAPAPPPPAARAVPAPPPQPDATLDFALIEDHDVHEEGSADLFGSHDLVSEAIDQAIARGVGLSPPVESQLQPPHPAPGPSPTTGERAILDLQSEIAFAEEIIRESQRVDAIPALHDASTGDPLAGLSLEDDGDDHGDDGDDGDDDDGVPL